MKESRDMLRQRYQAETDVEIDPQPIDWEQYATWLEHLAINEVNNELVLENELLRSKMKEAIDTLYEGISGRHPKQGREKNT